MRKISIFIVVLAFVVLVSGCVQPPIVERGKIKVAASFFPVENFARQVAGHGSLASDGAGDRAEVVAVIPSGLEPHDYEPTARDLSVIYDSRLFVYSGAGLEPWAEKIRPELEAKGIQVLRLSDSMELLSGIAGKKTLDVNQSDPHVWLDPVLAQAMVERIRDTLIVLDPENAASYQANSSNYLTKLKSLDVAFGEGLSNCKDHTVLLSHAAFQYLAKRYGFKTLSISGFSEGEEPSLKDFAGLIENAKRLGLHFIFFDSQSNPKLAETLAAEIGGKTLDMYHIDGGFTAEESANPNLYLDLMRKNLDNLKKALQCS